MSWQNDYKNDVRDVESVGWWTLGKVIVILLILGAVGFAFHALTQPVKVVNRVIDGDNIVDSQQWFQTQYNDYLANQVKVDQAKKQLDDFKKELGADRNNWSYQDKDAYNQLNSSYNALQLKSTEIANTYNARSKFITMQLWKNKDLPKSL